MVEDYARDLGLLPDGSWNHFTCEPGTILINSLKK